MESKNKLEKALRNKITASVLREYQHSREQNRNNPLLVLDCIMMDVDAKDADRVSAAFKLASLTLNKAPTEAYFETVDKSTWELDSDEYVSEIKNKLRDKLKAKFSIDVVEGEV